jgi:hypothetical protein
MGVGYGPSDYFSDSCTITVLHLEITSPTEGSPSYENQFVLRDTYSPPRLTISAEGTTGIQACNADLEWDLDWEPWDVSPSTYTLTSDPASATGPDVEFTYQGDWPWNNSDFGPKTLTLTHGPSGFSTTCTLEVFFDPEVVVVDSPPYTPNWFYYWQEGEVLSNMGGFQYGGYNENYAGKFDAPWLYLYSPLAFECDAGGLQTTCTNRFYGAVVNTGENGICDTTADPYDVQVIPVGEGEPHKVAITDGGNGLETTPAGDDQVVGTTITTGADGICQTTPAGNDVYVYYGDIQMAYGNGKAYTTCITGGSDGYMHSAVDASDNSLLESDDVNDLSNAYTVAFDIPARGLYRTAIVCTHELTHQQVYGWSGTHSDNDTIPDSYEVAYHHFDPERIHSYMADDTELDDWFRGEEGGHDDREAFAYVMQNVGSGATWHSTPDPDEDWSEGGEQWHQ